MAKHKTTNNTSKGKATQQPAKGKATQQPAKGKASKATSKPATTDKAKTDLTPNMVAVLTALQKHGAMSRKELADKTGIAKGMRSKQLENLGYITRSDQEGVRGLEYAITAKGKQALAKATK